MEIMYMFIYKLMTDDTNRNIFVIRPLIIVVYVLITDFDVLSMI